MEDNNLTQTEVSTEKNKINGKTILLIGGAIGGLALAAIALLKKKSGTDEIDDFEEDSYEESDDSEELNGEE